MKLFLKHLESEYVMSFLMGINELYAATRAKFLLMNPISAINTVFALIIQDERQRVADQFDSLIDPIALLTTDSSKKFALSNERSTDRF